MFQPRREGPPPPTHIHTQTPPCRVPTDHSETRGGHPDLPRTSITGSEQEEEEEEGGGAGPGGHQQRQDGWLSNKNK